jgi:glutamate:GABA antiporter
MAGTIDEIAQNEQLRVEAHSAELKKELGLRDLVLQQIVYVVGTIWVGTAAKLGHSQVVFWLAAMLLFYLPQAAVVIHLTRRMPLEGGLYQWARLGLGELAGFLVAWNLWVYAVVLIATIGLVVSTNLSYAVGPAGSWMATNKTFIMVLNAFLLCGLMVLAAVGLGVAKWLHNAGSVMLMTAFAALIALPFFHMARGTLPHYQPFAIAMPALSLLSLNIFGKLAMGALSGFEYVAVLAGETKNPERTIGRATIIAAPIIAAMFILGTSAVLAFVPIDKINLIGPIPQVLSIGFGASGAGAMAAAVAIVLITGRTIANSSIVFTATTRMPMVAGWDNLLPRWFTTLHPRYRTPINSILFVGLVALAFGAVGIAGVGEQEAFQLLENAAGIFYGLTYLVMFAIPIVGMRRADWKPSMWLRIASISGFSVTLLYVVLSIFPIIDVASWSSFAVKISGVVIGLNLAGLFLYLTAQRRRAAVRVAATCVLFVIAGKAQAQTPVDSTKCDSIVFASSVGSVKTAIFVSANRMDGAIPPEQLNAIVRWVASSFATPRPFRISVFSGSPQMPSFRRLAKDTIADRRAPAITGVYRFWSVRAPSPTKPFTIRASLVPGFDNAALDAVASVLMLRDVVTPPAGEDSMLVDVRFSSDSSPNAVRMISAVFPVMPVVGAVPIAGNLRAPFPESEKADASSGEVVVRFVVDRAGTPIPETVEVIRGTSIAFLRSALTALPEQHFQPARIKGCAVAQVVEYPFSFVPPETQKIPPRY